MTMLHTACSMIVMWAIFGINQVTGKDPPPTKPSPSANPKRDTGTQSSDSAVIGGAVGAGVAVVIIVIIVVYCVRSRRRNRDQPDTKQNGGMARENLGANDVEQPTAPGDNREPYTGLTNPREIVAQGNVYDELGGVSNVDRTPTTNEETEYCYISDSDIIAAQRQSTNPIPTVRNNKSAASGAHSSQSNPGPSISSIGYNASDVPSNVKQLSQTGNQHISSYPDDEKPQPHEYLELVPEQTSL